MDLHQWRGVRDWFISYVDLFRTNGNLDLKQELKLLHSLKTSEECIHIANHLEFNEEAIQFAGLLGLLHDVGRFEQWSAFGTFDDSKSIDHGFLGSTILKASEAYKMIPEDLSKLLLISVTYHNKKSVPVHLDDLSKRWLHLIRDADKIDIFRVICGELDKGNDCSWDHADPDLPASSNVIKEFEETRSISYKNIRSLRDLQLMQISWVYGLNYDASRKRLVESSLWDKIKYHIRNRGHELDPYIAEADHYLS